MKHINQIRLFFVLTTILFACNCQAQTMSGAMPSAIDRPLTFSYISINEGLPSNTILSTMQDRYGWIWIGTDNGLAKYNGQDITRLRSTASIAVNSIVEKGDSILVGTEYGLFLYLQDADSIRRFEINQQSIDLSSVIVNHIAIDNEGTIWLCSYGNGIIRINGNTAERVPTPGDSYAQLAIDHYGDVWSVSSWTEDPIVKYSRKEKKFKPYNLDLPSHIPTRSLTLTCGSDKHLWMASTYGNIIRFHPHNHHAEVILQSEQTSLITPHVIFEQEKGTFLIGSDNGLFKFHQASGAILRQTRSTRSISPLSDNFIYTILKDKEGGIWIGTYFGGINYTHPYRDMFTYHWHSDDINTVQGNIINGFYEDTNHHIWITSDDAGLTLYIPQKQLYIPVKLTDVSGVSIINTHGIQQYGNKVFVGTYSHGLFVIDINTLQVSQVSRLKDNKGNFIDNSVYSFCIDKDSCLWVGTHSSICTYDIKRGCAVRRKQTNSSIQKIIQDKNGGIWFATSTSGIYSYRNKQWKHFAMHNRHNSASATNCSITCDSEGNIWVGSNDGLYIYNNKKADFEPVDVGAEGAAIYGLTSVADNIWITTNNSMLRVPIKQKKVTQVIKRADNIYHSTSTKNSVYKTSEGKIYLGTNHGFISFVPSNIDLNIDKVKVVFTNLEVKNEQVAAGSKILPKSISHTKEIHLKHSENTFRLAFAAMSYILPAEIQYAYKLEGFDNEWIWGGNHHSISYTNMKPGTYTFQVKAKYDNSATTSVSSIKIVIEPPFYWNTYSQLLYALLVFLALYMAIERLLKRKDKKHEREIEHIQTSAQKEIENIHTSAQKEIESIHSSAKKEIEHITTQKEKEIEHITTQKEKEVHDAYIKRMTITQKEQEFLNKLESIIESNYTNSEFTIEDIANELGISRTGLFTKLKALADVTPNEMLQIIRLRHAADLLLQKQYRVSEVCYMVGFSSPSYFGKCFQKQYGVTPAKYTKA